MLRDQKSPKESMDSNADRVVARLNIEEIINNYNTWNHLTVSKLISSLTFLNVNLLHIIRMQTNDWCLIVTVT